MHKLALIFSINFLKKVVDMKNKDILFHNQIQNLDYSLVIFPVT